VVNLQSSGNRITNTPSKPSRSSGMVSRLQNRNYSFSGAGRFVEFGRDARRGAGSSCISSPNPRSGLAGLFYGTVPGLVSYERRWGGADIIDASPSTSDADSGGAGGLIRFHTRIECPLRTKSSRRNPCPDLQYRMVVMSLSWSSDQQALTSTL